MLTARSDGLAAFWRGFASCAHRKLADVTLQRKSTEREQGKGITSAGAEKLNSLFTVADHDRGALELAEQLHLGERSVWNLYRGETRPL